MATIEVYFLPQLAPAAALEGRTVVVIDVLRATTTITAALAAGARRVIPCGEIDEATAAAARVAAVDHEKPLRGGERGGLPIPGFDLGNSPAEYAAETVRGKTVVFTTTNGTRAMLHCREAARVFLAAFVNLDAVVAKLRSAEEVSIVCAGTGGEITREDVLAAGAVTHRLMLPDDPVAAGPWARATVNDQARLARDAWQAALPPTGFIPDLGTHWLAKTLAETTGGRNLQRIGLARDIVDCAALNELPVLPELDLNAWEIRLR